MKVASAVSCGRWAVFLGSGLGCLCTQQRLWLSSPASVPPGSSWMKMRTRLAGHWPGEALTPGGHISFAWRFWRSLRVLVKMSPRGEPRLGMQKGWEVGAQRSWENSHICDKGDQACGSWGAISEPYHVTTECTVDPVSLDSSKFCIRAL